MDQPDPDSATPLPAVAPGPVPADGDAPWPPADPDPSPDPAPATPGRARRRTVLLGGGLLVVAGAIVAWRLVGPLASGPTISGPAAGLTPLLALVDSAGGIATMDAAGHRSALTAGAGPITGFPAWAPDGTRIAAIREAEAGTEIAVLPIPRAAAAGSGSPEAGVVIYRNSAAPPFYLYWTPDGRRVSFLATESDGVSLRVAPADAGAPLDGTGPGALIRQGSPLYFDWLAADRLLLHVGTGGDAFLGEVGADGAAVAPGLTSAGDFRPSVAGVDGRFLAYVRGRAPSAELVVAARDGSSEHALPVFGPAAAVFDPTGATVGSIAADRPQAGQLAFPIGPLRLVDGASGTARTVLDGSVVGFFWSPDGRTIAALRLQTTSGSTAAGGPLAATVAFTAAASSPSAVPPQPGVSEVHLLFLNVADGAIRSDRVVHLTGLFVNQFLPYFDQYALSHRVWSPDSASIALPFVDQAGRDRLFIIPADGSDGPPAIDARTGFWSP